MEGTIGEALKEFLKKSKFESRVQAFQKNDVGGEKNGPTQPP
jgi:hypothetical protein